MPSLDEIKHYSLAELKPVFQNLFGTPPTARASRDFLLGNIAWALQVRAQGKEPHDQRRKLEHTLAQSAGKSRVQYKPGTRLVREWQGQTFEVIVLQAGYRWQGQRYRSLSRIAEMITGTRWSGPRFFGLKGSTR